MKSTTRLKSKKIRLALLLLGFVAVLVLATLLDGAYEGYRFTSEPTLTIVKEYTLKLREISGMFLQRQAVNNRFGTLYAVGDRYARLAVAEFDGKTIDKPRFIDFGSALVERFAPCSSNEVNECKKLVADLTSQWEGIAVDGAGKVFVLHEKYGSVFVLNRGAEQLLGVFNLTSFVPSGQRNKKEVPVDKDNALGEGLILLNNGHFLVIKERFPPAVIEYGKAGSTALGFTPALALAPGESFAVDAGITSYEPLHRWQIAEQYNRCDLSELAVSPRGKLHALSQQCQWIGRIGSLPPSTATIGIEQLWHLPHQLTHAESLVVVDKHTFLVAEDKRSSSHPNVFLLQDKVR